MQRPTRHGAGRENTHLRPPELSSSRPDAHLVESELMKLLVDECLSEELTKLAQSRGHAEASHVAWIGKRGWKDWQLKSRIIDGDWTFVPRKSVIFAVSAVHLVPKDNRSMLRSMPG